MINCVVVNMSLLYIPVYICVSELVYNIVIYIYNIYIYILILFFYLLFMY